MSNRENIFLIGPMGVGKSTIGRQLAERLKKEFIDADSEIESRTGASIELIFDIEGESGFRKREQRIIKELTAHNNIVLSTGGGAVLSGENRKHLKQRGLVVYLAASPENLMKRTAKDQKRPLLQTEDRLSKIKKLLEERIPLYEGIADVVINTDSDTTDEITDKICRILQSSAGNKG